MRQVGESLRKSVLENAQRLLYLNRFRHTWHSNVRLSQRAISEDDVEAAIQSLDAHVIEDRDAPDRDTYTVQGRRTDGDIIKVVVAFDMPEPSEATLLRIVSVMYPE